MKRYWKLVMMIPLIILSIGIYYAKASENHNPEFYLKTNGGNAQEVSKVILQANYQNGMLRIDSDGSEYPNEQPFWKSLDSNYYFTSDLKELAKEYPRFMRGKQNPNGFYVDNHVIGYATIAPIAPFTSNLGKEHSDAKMDIAVYDKQKNDNLSFEVILPKTNVLNFINLDKIRINGNTMNCFTLNFGRDGKSEVHLYTIDLVKRHVITDQNLLSYDSIVGNNTVNVSGVTEPNNLKQHSDLSVFQVTKTSPPSNSFSRSLESIELLVYDMKSGKLTNINDPTIISLLNGQTPAIAQKSGNDLLFITPNDSTGQPQIVRYSLIENKITNKFTVSFQDMQMNSGVLSSFYVKDNRMYMLITSKLAQSTSTSPTIAIADMNTGKIVYWGVVSRKDNKELSDLAVNSISTK